MKKLVLSALACILLTAPAYASKTIPITFAKGSYCGNYAGAVSTQEPTRFTLTVKKGQNVDVSVNGGDLEYITSPRGKSIFFHGSDGEYHFKSSQKGTYKFHVTSTDGYADVSFCVS